MPTPDVTAPPETCVGQPAPVAQDSTKTRSADVLRADSVCLKRGELRLKDVSLRVPAGGLVTLSGPVGTGKSTLASALAGAVPLESGRIAVEGRDVKDAPPHVRGVGWVPQEGGLFPRQTVSSQLAFPLRVRGVRRRERSATVWDLAAEWGIFELLQRQPDALSGGQRRLVAIARAVASAPRILLLDESLGSLDAAERGRTLDRLADWRRATGGGVLLITHRSGEVPGAHARITLSRATDGDVECTSLPG